MSAQEKNVAQLEHCSTRLRFTLNDQKKVDEDKLKAVPGVMGVVRSNQFQIIIGNDVVEVYDALLKMIDFNDQTTPAAPAEKQKLGKMALDFLIGIFQPLVPGNRRRGRAEVNPDSAGRAACHGRRERAV